MNDRALIRLASLIGFAGAILAIPANLLHPKTASAADTARIALIAESGTWNLLHYVAGAAVLLVGAGFLAFDRYMRDREGGEWARIAFFFGILGLGVGVILTAIDGYGLKALADAWAEAGARAGSPEYNAFNAVEQVSTALFGTFIGVALGLAPLIGGIAVLKSRAFTPVLGWIGIGFGSLAIVLDAVITLGGNSPFLGNYGFTLVAAGATLFLLGVTWNMFQATRGPDPTTPRASRRLDAELRDEIRLEGVRR
jgi:hypothetical protein